MTSSWRSRFRRPRTLASRRNEPACRTMPPIRSGSTERRRLDAPAGGLLDLVDDAAGLLVRERLRGRQLDGDLALLGGDEPIELVRDLVDLGDPALLGQKAQEVADDVVRAVGDRFERRRLGPGVDLRVAQDRRGARARREPRRRSRRAPPGPHRRCPAPSQRRRAPAHTPGERQPSAQAVSRSSTEKSRSPIASSIRRRWSSSSSTLPVTLEVASSVRSATSPRICSIERRVSASISLRVSSTRRARSASSSSLGGRAASRRPSSPRRGSPPPRRGPGRRAPGAPRAACEPRSARGRPRRSTGGSSRAARRSASAWGRTRTA